MTVCFRSSRDSFSFKYFDENKYDMDEMEKEGSFVALIDDKERMAKDFC